MGQVKFLGFPNHTSESYAEYATTGAASLEPAGMEVDFLGTEEPSELARLTSLDPANTQWAFGTSLIASQIDGLSLINHNVTGGGQIRFVGATTSIDGGFVIPTKVSPNTIVSSTNITGGVTNVDEDIYVPDGLVMTPTVNTTGWTVRLKWPSLAGTIDTQTHAMCIVLRARRRFSGAGATSPTTLPTIEVSIVWEPTLPILSTLGSRAITNSDSGGQILIFPFSRSNIPNTTDFQVYISSTPGLSASGGQYAELESIRVYYDTITASTPPYDSGWITIPEDTRRSPKRPIQSLHYFPSTPWTGVLGYGVLIRSDQAEHTLLSTGAGRVPASSIPTDPDTFVQAGVLCAGVAVSLADGRTAPYAPPTKIVTEDVVGTTGPGQTYGASAWSRIVSEPIEFLVTRDELLFLQGQIAWRRGHSGAFYIALESGVDLADQEFSGFWCTVSEVSAPAWAGNDSGVDMYTVSLTFEQKL